MRVEDLRKSILGSKPKKDDEDNLIEKLYIIMKEFGYTIEEVRSLPIPTFKYLIHLMIEESKDYNKSLKKK